jgi:DNA-binding MarR family transcriptional regulator
MKEKEDFGVLLALAYATFVDDLRAELARQGYADIHRSFGYVARTLSESALTLRDLAARLGITSQGALKIVDEMEATGYVVRRADPHDARAKRLYLSKRGDAALAAARRFHRRFEAGLRARIGAKAVDAARAMLGEIVADSERAGRTAVLRPV